MSPRSGAPGTSPRSGVVWGWWSKHARSARDYELIDASTHDATERIAINAEIERLGLGNPSSTGSPGRALPWVAFAGLPADGTVQRVLWWDWTGELDEGGREIFAVLYLRLHATGRVSFGRLANYAHDAWQTIRDDRGARLEAPSPDVPGRELLDWLSDEVQFQWVAAVAALALTRPVRIVEGEDGLLADRKVRVWLFDAVAALLPAGVQPLLSHASWLNNSKNERYRLALSRRPDQPPAAGWAGLAPAAVSWGSRPDLSDDPQARYYRDTLLEMRQRHSLADVLAHLVRHADPLQVLGPRTAVDCAEYVSRIDTLYKIGLDLLAGQPVAVDTVRSLVRSHHLAGLPDDMHLAYLRCLLRHGGPEDLAAVAANWLPAALPALVDAALERAAVDAPGLAPWLSACLAARLATDPADNRTDELLTALLGSYRPDDAASVRLVQETLPVLRSAAGHEHVDLRGARRWLMADANVPWAYRFVNLLAPDGRLAPAALRWLDRSATGTPPPWLRLLHAATGAPPPASLGPPVDGRWLILAGRIATAHDSLPALLPAMMRDALEHLHRSPGDEDGVRLWLRRLVFTEPQAQASVDFLLLCGDDVVPPGLRAGSPAARDDEYALQLLAHADDYHLEQERFRGRLSAVLAGPDATADALDLYNAMLQVAAYNGGWIVDGAIEVADQRGELLDVEVPQPLWDRMLDAAPRFELSALLRRLDQEVTGRGDAQAIAGLLLRAEALQCEADVLRVRLKRWPSLYNHQHLRELMDHLVGDPDDDPSTYAIERGFKRLVELLPEPDRTRFAEQLIDSARRAAESLQQRTDALQQDIDQLTAQRRQQLDVAEMVEDHLGRRPRPGPQPLPDTRRVPVEPRRQTIVATHPPAQRVQSQYPVQQQVNWPHPTARPGSPPQPAPQRPPRTVWWRRTLRWVTAPARWLWRGLVRCWRWLRGTPAPAAAHQHPQFDQREDRERRYEQERSF